MFLAALLFNNFAITCNKPTFFGLVPWYQYLPLKPVSPTGGTQYCDVGFTVLEPNHPSSVLLVVLAILDDLVRIAAMVAVGFVIWGGIKLITSQGSPEGTKSGRQTIINALVGLVLALMAASLVSFIGNRLAG